MSKSKKEIYPLNFPENSIPKVSRIFKNVQVLRDDDMIFRTEGFHTGSNKKLIQIEIEHYLNTFNFIFNFLVKILQ